jgi:hypothetical protein
LSILGPAVPTVEKEDGDNDEEEDEDEEGDSVGMA